MKLIVWTGIHQVEIQEAPIPVPEPGQAVVRIRYAGICGSDLHVLAGQHPTAKPPLVLGHEAVGTLYAMNALRTDVKPGDKVCVHTVEPCRGCENCTRGRENLCNDVKIMGTNRDGVFTQYICVDADRVIRFSDDVDDKIAALVEPLTVGVHDIRRSGLQAGEDVLVAGAGPIGLIIGIMAKYAGAANVVLTEIDPVRIEMAEKLGFVVADPRRADFDEICLSHTNGAGFDRGFEITSVQSSFDAVLRLLKKGGVLVQVGMPPRGTVFSLDLDKLIYSECEVRGVRHHTMNDMMTAANIINSGVLNEPLSHLVSAVYPMDQCQEAIRKASTDKSMLRVLIEMN